jgi:hypothetical protein
MFKLLAIGCLAVASSLSIEIANEPDSSCTGSGDPPSSSGLKYAGSVGALGVKEQISITVSKYGGGQGTLDVHATGVLKIDCKGKKFTKSGQDIQVDVSDCASGVELKVVKYCSDQDIVHVEVDDPKLPGPIGKLTVKGDLKRSTAADAATFFSEEFIALMKGNVASSTCSHVGDCGKSYQACCIAFGIKGFACDCHLQDGSGTAAANCGDCGTEYSACCIGFAAKGYPCECDVA